VDLLHRRVEVVPGPALLGLDAGLGVDGLVDHQGHRVGPDRDAEQLSVDLAELLQARSEALQRQMARLDLRAEIEQHILRVVFPQETDGILEHVRRISTGRLGVELLPEVGIGLEVGLDLDLRVLLLEKRDGLLDARRAVLGAPPGVTDRHRSVPRAAAAATGRGSRPQPRDGQ
jgi:hypothetical protein